MQHLGKHNANEDSSGGLNFRLTLPEARDTASAGGTPVGDSSDHVMEQAQTFDLFTTSEWPSNNAPVPGSMHGSIYSPQPSTDPELASIMSPTVPLAGSPEVLSRQASIASYRSSTMALTAAESTAIDASKFSVSRMSVVSNERPPLLQEDAPDDVAQASAALRASLAADESLQGGALVPAPSESPRIAAGKGGRQGPFESGLADMAEALAGATGAPPWFSPALARKPRAPIGAVAYTALLRAVLTAWQQEPDAAEGLLQRLHFAEYLRDILQVPEETHNVVLTAALGANSALHEELQHHIKGLEHAKRSLSIPDPSRPWVSPPAPTATSGAAIDAHILDQSHFLTDEAFRDYVALQLRRVGAARALAENMPQYAGVLRVQSLSLQGLGDRGKKKAKRGGGGLFSCCLNPKFELEEEHEFGDSLFFKMWLSLSGEKSDKQKIVYTTSADSKTSEGPRSHTRWPDGPLEFAAGTPAAMLCIELRNMTDMSAAARSALGKPGSGYSFDRLGSVSVRVSDLQPAGTGKHRCTVSVFALPSATVATGATAPLTAVGAPHITKTLREDHAVHTEGTGGVHGEIIATLTFVYELILDVRKLPEGNNKIAPDETLAPPEALVETPAAPTSNPDTVFVAPSAAEKTPAPRHTWPAGEEAPATRNVVHAAENMKGGARNNAVESDDSGLDDEDEGDSDENGADVATGAMTRAASGEEGSVGGSPMLARRMYKQGSLLHAGSPHTTTPKINKPRIIRGKSSTRRSAAHPFATSGPSRTFPGSIRARGQESISTGHGSQKSFQKFLQSSGIASMANMHGGGGSFNSYPGDGKYLEGVHATSATFVEVFTCLWALWREKVDAGSATEMSRVVLPQACIPEWIDEPAAARSDHVTVPSLHTFPSTLSDETARVHLPPQWMLSLLATVAHNMHIRSEEALLLALTALSSTPPLVSTAPSFPSRLHVLRAALIPLATAARTSLLTHGEAGTFARGVSPLLAESAWALDRMHVVLLSLHGPDALVEVVTLTAAAIRFTPEPSGISPLILPHFREAVARRMIAHHALTEVSSKYDAVPMLIEAMRTIISDLKLEAEMIPDSFRQDLEILQVSASYRYGMIVSAVQRLWKVEGSRTPRTPKTPVTPRTPKTEHSLLYDGLLQQLEDTFQELHLLMLDLDVTALLEDDDVTRKVTGKGGVRAGLPTTKRLFDGSSADPGTVTFLPCKGLKLLDITVMLAPVISSWLSAVGIKLESYAASAVAADAQAGNRSWAPLARLSGVLCSSSVVDLFYVIVNGVDKVAARAMVNRPPAAAVAAAEAVAAAAGGAIRWYAGAVEAAALADLQQVALAANAARTLPPAGRALLTAHLEEERGFGAAGEEGASSASPSAKPIESWSVNSQWPPLIKREFSVKLNNLQEASLRTEAVAHKVAQYLLLADDPLRAHHSTKSQSPSKSKPPEQAAATSSGGALHEPIKSTSPELGVGGKGAVTPVGSRPKTGSEIARVSHSRRVSMEQKAIAAEIKVSTSLQSELSFMSDGIHGVSESGPHSEESLPEAEEVVLPPDVHSVFFEVLQYVARCKLATLAAIKHAFCGVLTLEIAKVLAPAGPPKHSRLSSFIASSLARTLSDTLSVSARQTAPECDPTGIKAAEILPAVPEDSKVPEAPKQSFRMTFSMSRNPILPHAASSRPAKPAGAASSQKIQEEAIEGLLDSAALGGLLEIIDREFQVMKECLVPQLFEEVLLALWKATCEVLEGFLLASLPSQSPLTPPQVKVLESLLTFLKDYFHADGAGIPLSRLDYTATRAERLFQLFTAHTEALSAHWEVLLEDNAARTVSQDVPEQNVLAHTPPPAPSVGSGGGGMGAASRRAADVTQVDLLRLLRQRKGDAKAKKLLQDMLEHTEKYAMQILFDLPDSERIVARCDCTLMGHRVAGTLFLSASYLCFSSMAPAASHTSTTQSSLRRLSSASAAASALFGPAAPETAAVTMAIPLAKVTMMSDAFIRRYRALVFTLLDKTQVEFAKFVGTDAHNEFQQQVRLHVVGTGSTLDRTLRGVEMAAAPAWLKLPPGEHVERSYACALYSLVGKYRGALHVCREILLFAGYENKYRTVVRFEQVLSVELSKGHWLRGVHVVVTCSKHPHKLEFCEMAEPHAEEMVAEILDCIARRR